MAATTTKKVQELLEKMKHYDSDERSMATMDLINELKNTTLEATLQAPVRQAIILQLEDKSPNVSTIAVKCLATIVTQFAPEHLVAIVDKLGTMIVDPERESREMVADASKTVIAAVSVEAGKTVMVTFVRSVVTGLNAKPSKEGGLELSCLDVLKDVLTKFGPELATEHNAILTALTKLLEHPNESVRKRATATIGPLVVSLTEDLFNTFMQGIIRKIESTRKPDIYIQTIGSVSTAAGVRVAPFLDKIIPALERFCKLDEKKAEESSEEDIELWESCLKSLDSIVRRCPNKVTPYVAGILATATTFLSHDPNYSYDMDGGADDGDDDGFGGDDAWGDDGDAWDDTPKKKTPAKAAAKAPAKAAKPAGKKSWNMPGEGVQDADSSWKVRQAAIRVISAFIRVRSDILKTYYSQLSDTLVSRFKERDSAVKEEILLACRDLLHETVVSGRAPVAEKEDASLAVPEFIRTRSSYETLELKTSAIVDACDKEFKSGDVRTQKAIMTLLSELVLVRQGSLALEKILPHVVSGIEGTGEYAGVNADALKLAQFIFEFHTFANISGPLVAKLNAACVKAVKAGNQAIVPEALRVLGSICKIAAKQPGQDTIAREAYKAVFSQLVLNDVPQKMKLSAISAMSTVLAAFGGVLVAECKQAVPVLTDRLSNDVTRQPALRAFTRIANSETKADLSLLATNSPVIKEVSTFVRKALPVLRHETVTFLEALLRTQSSHVKAADVQAIIVEVSAHISDEDLSMTHLVVELVSTALTVSAAAAVPKVASDVLPKVITLVKSQLLQGKALESLIKFFAVVVGTRDTPAPLQFAQLLTTLFGVVDGSLSKSSRLAVAQCIAGMTKRAGADKITSTVAKCIGDVTKAGPAHVQTAALLTLGSIGQQSDLSENKTVESVITSAFDSKDDETRAAAAYALGNVAVGNLARFLPSLLALIGSRPTYQYLLFTALKEAVAAQSKTRDSMAVFVPYVDTITPILTKHAESKDEGVRDMVAQCLGLTTVLEPVKLLAILERFVRGTDANLRVVAMTGLRFAFSPLTNWPKIGEKVDLFLGLLRDADLGVRRQAVLTLNALARANIETIPAESLKRTILPALYDEVKPHPELIREVDFGAFKEIIDDGLPLRKAVFQCLGTLLDVAPHRLDMQIYINKAQEGLVDHADIQISTFQIFSDIARQHGSALLEVLDSLPTQIMKSVKAHIQASKSKEPEQALDCLRAIVRAMSVFNKIPGVEQATKYTFFVKQIAATPLLAQMQKEIDA